VHIESGDDMLRAPPFVPNFYRMANRFDARSVDSDTAAIECALDVRNREIDFVHSVFWNTAVAGIRSHAVRKGVELASDESGSNGRDDGCFIQSAVGEHLIGIALINKRIRQA
jgi:hypothetical protein